MNISQKKKQAFLLSHIVHKVSVVVGVVLIWRGIWYVLDQFDLWIFGGSHTWTALGGIFIGLIILYLPDKDLKEIEKL